MERQQLSFNFQMTLNFNIFSSISHKTLNRQQRIRMKMPFLATSLVHNLQQLLFPNDDITSQSGPARINKSYPCKQKKNIGPFIQRSLWVSLSIQMNLNFKYCDWILSHMWIINTFSVATVCFFSRISKRFFHAFIFRRFFFLLLPFENKISHDKNRLKFHFYFQKTFYKR